MGINLRLGIFLLEYSQWLTNWNQSRIGNIPIRILSGSLMGINLGLGIFLLEYSQWLTDGNQSRIGTISIRILTVAH